MYVRYSFWMMFVGAELNDCKVCGGAVVLLSRAPALPEQQFRNPRPEQIRCFPYQTDGKRVPDHLLWKALSGM